ncbi:MAG: IPExxxVDY family protein [Flavobacteriales bacterium]|nr:IPExxxVDY family protein [Flavobacteriales bacterium]
MELDIEYDFSLIGINTVYDDYQLAFYLNKYLDTNFTRTSKDLDVRANNGKELYYFPLFLHEDIHNMDTLYLINNKYTTENNFFEKDKDISQNLFFQSNQSTETTRYFIPEKKEVDYLIRLEDSEHIVSEMVRKIRSISEITTAFYIEYNTLRSKRNLIF